VAGVRWQTPRTHRLRRCSPPGPEWLGLPPASLFAGARVVLAVLWNLIWLSPGHLPGTLTYDLAWLALKALQGPRGPPCPGARCSSGTSWPGGSAMTLGPRSTGPVSAWSDQGPSGEHRRPRLTDSPRSLQVRQG
jgi:hypothetical protein